MENNYIDDLREIKDIMNRSSRFISLSGLSGVAVGIIALGGAYLAHQTFYSEIENIGFDQAILFTENIIQILLIASGTIILAVVTGIFFTTRKAKKQGLQTWDQQSKRLLVNLFIPLITGGLVCLILLLKGFVGMLAPLTLIFHGLALINASKYTLTEIRSLGLLVIILGLLALNFIELGLLFWALGFGVLHILYGLFIERKYKS